MEWLHSLNEASREKDSCYRYLIPNDGRCKTIAQFAGCVSPARRRPPTDPCVQDCDSRQRISHSHEMPLNISRLIFLALYFLLELVLTGPPCNQVTLNW